MADLMNQRKKVRHNSSGGFLKKIKGFLWEAMEWAANNKKISVPVVVAVVVVLLVVVALGSKGKKEEAAEEEKGGMKTDTPVISVPEVPLEEDAVEPVNQLISKYYDTLASGDVDALLKLQNYISDTDKIKIQKKSNYIEKYDNIICYTKAGLVEDSYLVYAYNEAKFYDIDTPAPALNTFVVYKNEAGEYYIYEGDLDDNTFNYFQELSGQEDVKNLCNTVEAKYNEAVGEDSALAEFMEEYPQKIKDEVSLEIAKVEDASTEVKEETKEEEKKPTPAEVIRVVEVEATDTVNVRSSDSENADKLGKVPKGTRLPLIEKKENGWSKVKFEDKEAFIKSEYLADVVNVATETKKENQKTAEKPKSNGAVGKDGKVTAKSTVNVRASASQTAEKLGVIYKGDQLELIMQQADGWCKVKFKGKTAYVKTEFVE